MFTYYLFPGQLGIWKCWFLRRREFTEVRGEKQYKGESQQTKLNPYLTHLWL